MRSRTVLAVVLGSALATHGRAADQVLIFGDSLSKEYSVEFVTDGYPSTVKNWIEILNDARINDFDYGSYSNLWFDYRAAGHRYNWAVPGWKIQEYVDIVEGKTFGDQLARSTIRGQLQNEVERFVLFVGGNDADSVYGTAYSGGSIATTIAEFIADAETILDWVLAQNPFLEVVVVGVPHVGITPKVKGENPPHPVNTGYATAAFAQWNAGLEALAVAKGVGFADIFAETLDLLDPDPLCIQGVPFINDGDAGGSLDYVWLAGPVSDNFHPNTNGCALLANAIIDAFNARYGSGIAHLTTEEILGTFLGKNADISFGEWLACYGFAGGLATDDPELDGFCYLAEFGLGLDPRKRDEARAPVWQMVESGGTWYSTLTYRPRLSGASAVVEVTGSSSTGLAVWTDATAGQISQHPDGRLTVWFPVAGPAGYQRIEVRLLGP